MTALTRFGSGAVTLMLLAYALEHRAASWVPIFALACAASSLYGWLAGTWPFGIVEGIWAIVALRRRYARQVPHDGHDFRPIRSVPLPDTRTPLSWSPSPPGCQGHCHPREAATGQGA